jgi:hypothetical protein
VLLPCASSLLLPKQSQLDGQEEVVLGLLVLSSKAVALSTELPTLGIPSATPPAAWVEERLDVLLPLADRLLYQQPPTQAAAAAAPAMAGSSASTSSSLPATRALCAGQLLPLLIGAAGNSLVPCCGLCSSDNRDSHDRSDTSQSLSAANCSSGAVAVPPLAAKFVNYVTAPDAALRAVAGAEQSGTISKFVQLSTFVSGLCSLVLLPGKGQNDSVLLQHMGLCGPVALAQEQQQLYSVLSTLQKLHCCAPGALSGIMGSVWQPAAAWLLRIHLWQC